MSRPLEFLASQKILHLATVGPDMAPHVVPVWYLYQDGSIHIGTHTRTLKARNIQATGRAAFCTDKGVRSPLYGVMGRGPARLVTDPDYVCDMAIRIMSRYFDDVSCASAQELLADTDCIIVIKPGPLVQWS